MCQEIGHAQQLEVFRTPKNRGSCKDPRKISLSLVKSVKIPFCQYHSLALIPSKTVKIPSKLTFVLPFLLWKPRVLTTAGAGVHGRKRLRDMLVPQAILNLMQKKSMFVCQRAAMLHSSGSLYCTVGVPGRWDTLERGPFLLGRQECSTAAHGFQLFRMEGPLICLAPSWPGVILEVTEGMIIRNG